MNIFCAVFLNKIMRLMDKMRLGLTVLTFVSAVSAYLFCLFLIISVNIIIRMAMFLILLVVWLDRVFHSNSKGIHGSAKKQSSSVNYRNQKLKTMEKEINNTFANLFLLWIPANITSYDFFDFLLYVHRKIFRIPASFHGIIFLRLFYSNFNDGPTKSVNRCGSADDKRPKKYPRCNFRHFFIYWFILSFHHTCTALIQVLLLTVRVGLNFYIWISTQREPSERKPLLSNHEHIELENLACAKRIKTSYIAQAMKPKFLQILLVWSPTDTVTADAIATFLFNIERNVEIREKWNRIPSMTDYHAIFGGIMATFPSFEKLSKAVQTLAVYFKHLKCIPANKLLSFIMHAEASHLECGFKNCEVIIHGRCGINKEGQRQNMKEVLSEFGIIHKITFNENFQNSGRDVICTLEYAFITHAYFLKLYMDGKFLSNPFKGRMFIEIKESAYVKEIMGKVKGKLIQSLEQNHLCDF